MLAASGVGHEEQRVFVGSAGHEVVKDTAGERVCEDRESGCSGTQVFDVCWGQGLEENVFVSSSDGGLEHVGYVE